MIKSVFVCSNCGNEFAKWQGQCGYCKQWNSLVESLKEKKTSKASSKTNKNQADIQKLSQIKLQDNQRISTVIPELDRVLGGGLVLGQVVLIAGEPGIGKSTLLMQVSGNVGKTIYISGEESSIQVAMRAKRLGIKSDNVDFIESNDVDEIIDALNKEKKFDLVVVDSIQTISTSDLTGMSGSVGQIRECAYRLLRFAKNTNTPLVMVGHVTKEGTVAGPSLLAHIVDTVLWFEGERNLNLRLLRSFKNRFGSTDEVGIFEMGQNGLISINDTNNLFIEGTAGSVSGSALSLLMEGTRSILVEIQSLVIPTKLAFPKRVAQGIDAKRLEMLIAVMSKRLGVPLYEMDVFVSIAGGIKTKDPGIDLAICLSILSSYYDKPLVKKLISIGEVGLLGEIRNVVMQEKRIKDAKRLGFKQIISPGAYSFLKEAQKNSFLK